MGARRTRQRGEFPVRLRRARLGATAVLTTAPVELERHRDRRRALVEGALIFQMASGRWQRRPLQAGRKMSAAFWATLAEAMP